MFAYMIIKTIIANETKHSVHSLHTQWTPEHVQERVQAHKDYYEYRKRPVHWELWFYNWSDEGETTLVDVSINDFEPKPIRCLNPEMTPE